MVNWLFKVNFLTQKCFLRLFAPAIAVPKIPEGEKVDFDVSDTFLNDIDTIYLSVYCVCMYKCLSFFVIMRTKCRLQ